MNEEEFQKLADQLMTVKLEPHERFAVVMTPDGNPMLILPAEGTTQRLAGVREGLEMAGISEAKCCWIAKACNAQLKKDKLYDALLEIALK